MATVPNVTEVISDNAAATFWSRVSAYDQWIESVGIPVHKGYYIEDLRTLELGDWEERGCRAAFLKLAGQEGVSEARVTEIPPGKTLPPLKFTLDEIVYVVEGRGLTTLWGGEGKAKKTFEWQKHSMFLVPRNYSHQLSNMQGDRPVRLLHYNYLPISMSIVPDIRFYFENPYVDLNVVYGHEGEFYSQATLLRPSKNSNRADGRRASPGGGGAFWFGNFFPDMKAWDQLVPFKGRGAGGHAVWIRFPSSPLWSHMSVFPSRTYKKAHRHGPGVVIVIPEGEGFSVMWPEGKERVVIPWHEASVFVPPDRWFHQHFNVSGLPSRYLAFHSPRGLNAYSEKVEDRARDQIEYPDEDPWIREKFEGELAKRGLKTLMPAEAYRDSNFEWTYEEA